MSRLHAGSLVDGLVQGAQYMRALRLDDEAREERRADRERTDRRENERHQKQMQMFDLQLNNAKELAAERRMGMQRMQLDLQNAQDARVQRRYMEFAQQLVPVLERDDYESAGSLAEAYADVLEQPGISGLLGKNLNAAGRIAADLKDGKLDSTLEDFNRLFSAEINRGSEPGEAKVLSAAKIAEVNGSPALQFYVQRFNDAGEVVSEGWMTKDRKHKGDAAPEQILSMPVKDVLAQISSRSDTLRALDYGFKARTGRSLSELRDAAAQEQQLGALKVKQAEASLDATRALADERRADAAGGTGSRGRASATVEMLNTRKAIILANKDHYGLTHLEGAELDAAAGRLALDQMDSARAPSNEALYQQLYRSALHQASQTQQQHALIGGDGPDPLGGLGAEEYAHRATLRALQNIEAVSGRGRGDLPPASGGNATPAVSPGTAAAPGAERSTTVNGKTVTESQYRAALKAAGKDEAFIQQAIGRKQWQ